MTIDEITSRKEDQTFDCKSIQIDPKALAVPIVAMANADGGVLAIGVSAKISRGAVIPTFHTDAFILKATLKAEFVDEDTNIDETDVPLNVAVNIVVRHKTELTERQKDILRIISKKPVLDNKNVPLNTKTLAECLGLGRKTMQRELNWLQEQGTIRWVGAKKNGHWEIISDIPNGNGKEQ